MHQYPAPSSFPSGARWLPVCLAAMLAACGGGGGTSTGVEAASEPAAPLATGVTTLQVDVASLPDEAATLVAQPTFHAAPVLLDPPSDLDTLNPSASASQRPHTQAVPAQFEGLATSRLTVQSLQNTQRLRALGGGSDTAAKPLATPSVVSTYTPAQIRAAYGLPALPAAGTPLTAAQAAQLGAGQTIYIVNAMHNPNVAAELAAFNQRFGLPGCTTKTIAPTAALPLPMASGTGCELSVVYATPAAGMTSVAPAYDAGWATEIALDVQWAHATAPLARIVLIEATNAGLDALIGGIKLANRMGPGAVSMSFGAVEGNYTASVDAAFTGTGMTYLAATGDSGASVSWPSVSPYVVAVGGTTLNYSGTGARSEVTWSGTGGGMSAYTARPSYQGSTVPGMGTPARRTVADVAFNANPSSGQYTAVMSPGSSAVQWMSLGGTSLSTPQWAGLVAVANAVRAQAAKPVLGQAHAVLYGQIASVPGTYAGAFADITTGAHGSCATCSAKAGYDAPTGLGTPNVGSLLSALAGSAVAATAPVVTPAAIGGDAGKALTFTVSVAAANPVTYTLAGAPAGMAIATTGVVTWVAPVAGTYAVTVTAKDSKSGLSGQGVYTVTIAAPKPPVVTAAAISAKVGTPLSFSVTASAANPLTYTLANAPSGMTVASTGVVSWPAPVAGTYAVTAVARDSKTGLTGQAVYTVTVAAASAPVVASTTVTGRPGTALSFQVAVTAANPVTYTLAAAPPGLAISATGLLTWASPVAGTYSVKVTARDSKTGLTGTGVVTLQVSAATGPSITAPAMVGVVGKALAGNIAIAAPGATSLSISISGAPLGMSFTPSGLNFAVKWATPVLGSYALKVVVVDNAGRTAAATVPVTINAK